MRRDRGPELKHARRPVPSYERAVKEVSRMLTGAGIRHALAGALAANAYRRRPRTTEDIDFLVGGEAFETHAGGFVTMRVPIVEFDGIDIDQVPLPANVDVLEAALDHAPTSEGVPIASLETVVIMKLLSGRTQDLADVEAVVESGVDREQLRGAVGSGVPECVEVLEKLFANVDRAK